MKKTIMAAGILTAAGFAGFAELEAYAAEEPTTPIIETGFENQATDTNTEQKDVQSTVPEEPQKVLQAQPVEDKKTEPLQVTNEEMEELQAPVSVPENLGAAGPATTASTTVATGPTMANGWTADKQMYYHEGEKTIGQKNIDGYWYLFDDNGKKLTSFQNLRADQNHGEAKTCYYNASGQMLYGQQNINGYWYCFDLFTGAMFRGETPLSQAYEKSGAKTVFYNNAGQMQYGPVNGKFYDGVTGALQYNRLCSYKGKTYYAKSNGTIHKGELYLNGKWKYFDENGVMKTSFVTLKKGQNGFKDEDKTVYYNANGDMLYGQQNINGKWYCFHNMTGERFTGLKTLSTAYERSGAKTVLYADDGHMLYGPQSDRYFDTVTGAMLKNIQKGNKYYGNDGKAVKGEVNIGGKWKCFNKDGNMVIGWFDLKNGELNYKGPDKRVYYNNKGEMVYKQQNIGGSWYCFEKNTGAMLRGEHYLDKNYEPSGAKTVRYYDGGANDGKMYYGFWTDPSSKKQKFYDLATGALLKNDYVQDNGYRYTADANGWITGKVEAKNMYGVDISNWQNGIDVSKLEADFVIVKATEGIDWLDKCFDKFAKQTIAAGKQLGFYHFANAKAGEAKKEANFFYNTVKPYIGQGVPILDWEANALKLGTGYAKEFLDEFYRLSGVKPLLYTSANVTREYDWSKVAGAGYKLWVAQYPDYNPVYGHQSDPWRDNKGTGAWGSPVMRQYTSTGHINGYNGNLDLNIFYGSIGEWKSLAKINK